MDELKCRWCGITLVRKEQTNRALYLDRIGNFCNTEEQVTHFYYECPQCCWVEAGGIVNKEV